MSDTKGEFLVAKALAALGVSSGGGKPPGSDDLSNNVRRCALANLGDTGTTMIGGFFRWDDTERSDKLAGYTEGYISEAKGSGSSFFNLGDVLWRGLSKREPEKCWQANAFFLDTVAERRDTILVSSNSGRDSTKFSGYLKQEIDYLEQQHGYTFRSEEGRLVPPRNRDR